MRDLLLDEIPNEGWRPAWDSHLSFSGRVSLNDDATLELFLKAIASDGIDIVAGRCEDHPHEICILAGGIDDDGDRWSDVPILMLTPEWSVGGPASQALAETIVKRWDDLRALHRSLLPGSPTEHAVK